MSVASRVVPLAFPFNVYNTYRCMRFRNAASGRMSRKGLRSRTGNAINKIIEDFLDNAGGREQFRHLPCTWARSLFSRGFSSLVPKHHPHERLFIIVSCWIKRHTWSPLPRYCTSIFGGESRPRAVARTVTHKLQIRSIGRWWWDTKNYEWVTLLFCTILRGVYNRY